MKEVRRFKNPVVIQIYAQGNPYGLTFDPSYVYAPNQGIRFFFGDEASYPVTGSLIRDILQKSVSGCGLLNNLIN